MTYSKSDCFRPCEEAHRRIRESYLWTNIVPMGENRTYGRKSYLRTKISVIIFNDFSVLSSPATRIGLVCMYDDVFDPRSWILMDLGAENGLKYPNKFLLGGSAA